VPTQDSAWGDQAMPPKCSRQPPDQSGEHGTVRPVQAWPRVGAAEHGDLVPEHEELDVLAGGRAAHQQDQSEYLQEDRAASFDTVLADAGIAVVKIPPRCRRANCFAKRWVLTVRTEVTDRMLIFGEQHLRRVLAEYSAHYTTQRPHRALQLRPPRPQSPAAEPVHPGSGLDRSSAGSSTSTRERPETADQTTCPGSGTRHPQAGYYGHWRSSRRPTTTGFRPPPVVPLGDGASAGLQPREIEKYHHSTAPDENDDVSMLFR
jgi:hypothetical protein